MSAPFDMGRLKAHLLLDNPFFGTLAAHLTYQADPAIPTLCTNGVFVKYNPAYMETLTHAEQLGVLAHEVLHPALLHPYRRNGRELSAWNEACDYVINAQLLAAGFTLPKGVLVDAQFEGMSAEQVYSKRRSAEPPPQPEPKPEAQEPAAEQEPGGDSDNAQGDDDAEEEEEAEGGNSIPGLETSMPGSPTGEFIDGPETASGDDPQLAEQDWELITAEAALVAARAGDLPGGVAQALKDTRAPQVDWVAETREFLAATIRTAQSWTRPNRRMIAHGLYLPGPIKKNVGPLVVAVDSSGSTWPMLEEFGAEVSGLMRTARPETLHVVYCDTRINSVDEYAPDDEVTLTAKGGGGTRFQPVFDWIEQEGLYPLAVIYLTDLEGPAPVEPTYPVLWVTPLYSRCAAPFGTHVRIP